MDASAIRQAVAGPLDAVLEKHRTDIIRIAGPAGMFTEAALANEETVRTIAAYCHELLPWPVRVAVKKPIFVDYVLQHREPLLARLVSARRPDAQSQPG